MQPALPATAPASHLPRAAARRCNSQPPFALRLRSQTAIVGGRRPAPPQTRTPAPHALPAAPHTGLVVHSIDRKKLSSHSNSPARLADPAPVHAPDRRAVSATRRRPPPGDGSLSTSAARRSRASRSSRFSVAVQLPDLSPAATHWHRSGRSLPHVLAPRLRRRHKTAATRR